MAEAKKFKILDKKLKEVYHVHDVFYNAAKKIIAAEVIKPNLKQTSLLPIDENFVLLHFTGHFDKNKNSIFEGDIALLHKTKIVIRYDKVGLHFMPGFFWYDNENKKTFQQLNPNNTKYLEVISSVFVG